MTFSFLNHASEPCFGSGTISNLKDFSFVDDGWWEGMWPHEGREILIRMGGDSTGPLQTSWDLATHALPDLAKLEVAADKLLRAAINTTTLGITPPWKLKEVQLPLRPIEGIQSDSLELRLTISGDDYGIWTVKFIHHSLMADYYVHTEFSRVEQG